MDRRAIPASASSKWRSCSACGARGSVSGVAARGARFRGAAAAARHQVPPRAAQRADGRVDDARAGARLKKEHKARLDAGLEAPALTPAPSAREVALSAASRCAAATARPSIRIARAVGLAEAAAERGALDLRALAGDSASRSTGRRPTCSPPAAPSARSASSSPPAMPTALFKSLARHFWFRTLSGADRARARENPPAARQADDGRSRLADRPHSSMGRRRAAAGAGADSRTPPERLTGESRRAAHRSADVRAVDALSGHLRHPAGVRLGCADYARTADGLPYIGPHRNFPHQLFAFGDSSHSVTGAYLASRILLRHHLGEPIRQTRRSSSTADGVDLLVFGPHPDDLEIGLGGTIARHAALGLRVGLCDLTAGEMGSNGTRRRAAGGSGSGARGARRRVAREPALARPPDRQGSRRTSIRPSRSSAAIGRASSRCRTGPIGIPTTWRRARVLTEAVFNAGCAATGAEGEAWKPDWICYYFINDAAPPSFVVDVSAHYEQQARGARLPRQPVPAAGDRAPRRRG